MRKATYSTKQVICKNASGIGYSQNKARPGYWIAWNDGNTPRIGRVMGRIDRTDGVNPLDCAGYIAVMRLFMECTHAGVSWVDPATVTHCYAKAPADLLQWITGDAWVKSPKDIARLVAMSEHGTTSESFIATRNDPDKAYNARAAYIDQFIL